MSQFDREHVWRLLQGGELIAPVPPLPPREVPDVVEPSSSVKSAQPGEQLGNGAVPPAPLDEAPLPTPPVKKTRTRKKAVTVPAEPTDPGPVIQVETGEPPAIIPAKRGRKKKTGGDEALAAKEQEAKSPSESPGQPSPVSTEADVVSAPTKPKRTRRVGEPKAGYGKDSFLGQPFELLKS